MRLIVFIISIFVLPSAACIASQLPAMCPRAKEDGLSLLANRLPTGWKRKLSKRAVRHPKHPAKEVPGFSPCERPTASVSFRRVINIAKIVTYGTGFRVACSVYQDKQVIVKTYVGIIDQHAIQNEADKWKRIGGFIGCTEDLRPPHHRDINNQEFHLIFRNSVPHSIDWDEMRAAIEQAFSVQIRETPEGEAEKFLNHTLSNPQELFWKKWGEFWNATPIFFTTESPIDKAISQRKSESITNGKDFLIFQTTYKNRPVTLKTYPEITGSTNQFVEGLKWSRLGLLIGTAVGPTRPHQFYTMILGNPIPDIPVGDIHRIITNCVKGNVKKKRYYANPQEFAWIRWGENLWSAIPIHFIAEGPISLAIESAFINDPRIGGGNDFTILRAPYRDRLVTLKTYFSVTTTGSMGRIHAYLKLWIETGLLIGAAVDLAPWDSSGYHKVTRFYIIMESSIPASLTQDIICAAIRRALGNGAEDLDYANPQEYYWTNTKPMVDGHYDPDSWIAEPIKFKSIASHT